ncbi:MAG: DMT family transporter, partial [Geminicoccaceae bacterium]
FLGEGYAISQVVMSRNAIGFVAILVFVMMRGANLAILHPGRPGLLALRTLFSLGAAFAFFTSLRFLPLADAFAIAFASPLFVTALSVPLLGEQVGIRRWSAVVLGFGGVLVVMQPSGEAFRLEALLALCAALCHAIAMLLGRKMTRDMTTTAIMFWPSLGVALVTLFMMPSQWQTPSLPDLGVFFLMGVVGTIGMSLITQGYRYAPAAVIAPFDYSSLLWASLLGWIIWQDIPGPNVWLGSAILIASGLYILYRETRRH